jgi:hypothetical protein
MAKGLQPLTGSPLDLEADAALLKAVGEMVANWSQLAGKVSGAGSAAQLIEKIAADVDAASTQAAFHAAGLDEAYTALKAGVKNFVDGAGVIPAKYKPLLQPLGDFKIGDANAQVGWTVSTPAAGVPAATPSGYKLDLGATAALTLNAADKWPADTPPVKLLSLAASVKVDAGASGKIPMPYATLNVGAGAKTELDLAYFFATDDAQIFALAAAEDFYPLADPFDYDSVWQALTGKGGLQALNYVFTGSANAQVQVAFADAGSLAAGIAIETGLTVGVSASLSSTYTLTLRRTPGAGGASVIAARLSRNPVAEADFSASLGVTVDASSLVQPAIAALSNAVGKWDAVLDDIRPFLSPGTWLRDKASADLQDAIKGWIKDPDLRGALISDIEGALGAPGGTDDALVKWLTGQVTGAIDRGSVLVQGDAAAAAGRVSQAIAVAAPQFAGLAGAKLNALAGALISKVKAALAAAVQGLLAKPSAVLVAAIKAAGAQVSGAVTDLDSLMKPVLDLLTRFDTALQDLIKGAEDAAKKKVTARLYLDETHTTGEVVEVDGTFVGRDDAAGRLFRSLTRGNLQSLVSVVDGELSAGSFHVEPTSAISRFSKTRSTSGLELAFLVFDLASTDVLSSSAMVTVDYLGNVHVTSQGEFDSTFGSGSSSRKVSFADSYSVAYANAMSTQPGLGVPVLDLSLGAVYSKSRMSWDDVSDFVSGLVDMGLLTHDVPALAQAKFSSWAGSAAIACDMAATLRLKGDQIPALLQLSDRQPGGLSDAARRRIYTAALNALLKSGAVKMRDLKPALDTMAGLYPDGEAPTDPVSIFLGWRSGLRWNDLPTQLPPSSDYVPNDVIHQDNYLYFWTQEYSLVQLVDLITSMGAIYTAPVGGAPASVWRPAVLDTHQQRLVADTASWLTTFSTIMSLFNSAITPRTLAFMRTMADLAGGQAGVHSGVTLTLTWRPSGAPAQTASFGS